MARSDASGTWSGAGTGLAVGACAGFLARDLDLPGFASYWGDRTPLIVIVALLGAALWLTPLRRLVLALALGLGLVWSLVAATPVSRWLAEGLDRHDAEAPTDAVFVLGSGIQPSGALTTPAMSRLVHGLELVGEGRAPRLILSELRPPSPSYAAAARPILEHLGLRAEIVTVGPVANTHDESVAVGALCRERGWTRLLVVTSPFHARRASALLEREGLRVFSSPAMETRFDVATLDRTDSRLMAFGSALHERVGWWLYARRGWLPESSR